MGVRRKAREFSLQVLYMLDFLPGKDFREVLPLFWKGRNCPLEVREFAEELIKGTLANKSTLDEVISRFTENWEMERMAGVDRNILRLATYEILYREDIPPTVSINEAIEIAKKYSTEESGKFVNGILDRIAQEKLGKG